MRISDWSSDVCSSDLAIAVRVQDLKLTTQELSANRAMFGHAASTLAKLDRAADDIERTAASARGIIDGDGRNAVAEVSGAARELKVAIGEARLTIADIGRQDRKSTRLNSSH